MKTRRISPNTPTGLAFEIADLMLLQGWADFHDVQMVVFIVGRQQRKLIFHGELAREFDDAIKEI